jgi:raffinose/stachyose/melibiose transport system substrate-binding protein
MRKQITVLCLVAMLLTSTFAACHAEAIKTYRVFLPLNEGMPYTDAFLEVLKTAEKELGIKFEIEAISDDDQYQQKWRTYIAAGDLPDIIGPTGSVSDANLAKQGKIVNLKPVLDELGIYDQIYAPLSRFQSFANGFQFALPEQINCEAFYYWKEPLEKVGVSAPKTWNEFADVCSKLKDAGYTPFGLAGKTTWHILRFPLFAPFRVTGNDFFNKLKKGEVFFGDEPGLTGVKLLETFGKNEYFQEGFSTMNTADVMDSFCNGNIVFCYTGTWDAPLLNDLYAQGKIDYMLIPDVDDMDNTKGLRMYLQGGGGYGFGTTNFDDNMKEFIKIWVRDYGSIMAIPGTALSPMTGADTSTLSLLLRDLHNEAMNTPDFVALPDSKFDSSTLLTLGTALNELALGDISAEEFVKIIDDAIATNAPLFFTDEIKDFF